MPTGYTRQSAADIVTGNTINAAPLNNEFNQVQAAMDATTGHNHDGTAGGGAPIPLSSAVTGTLSVTNGGTGASTAANARTNLGLTIGTDVQAYDPGLQSIAGLTTAANKMLYTTSSDVYAVADLTAAGRALLDDADATAQRTTLGLGSIATQNAGAVNITGGTIAASQITGTDTLVVPGAQTIQLAGGGSLQGTYHINASGGGNHHKLIVDVGAQQYSGAVVSIRASHKYTGSDLITNVRIVGDVPGDNRYLVCDTSAGCTITAFYEGISPGRSMTLTPGGSTVIGNTYPIACSSTGNVGVGTNSPSSRLDVNGDVTLADKIIHSGDTDTAIRFPSSDTVTVETGGSERMRISGTGTVHFPSVGTTASAANAFLDSSATPSNQLLRSTSSIRYKTGVTDITLAEAQNVFSLRPIKYQSLAEADDKDRVWYGLIAEEVSEVDQRLVHYMDGAPDGVQYERIIVPLLKIVKDLSQRVAALEAQNG